MIPNKPFEDPAYPILAQTDLPNEVKGDLWQHFNDAVDHNDLAARLAPLDVPSQIKQQLYDAKREQLRPVEPVDKAVAALNRLRDVHPDALDAAEKHPATMRAIVEATTKG